VNRKRIPGKLYKINSTTNYKNYIDAWNVETDSSLQIYNKTIVMYIGRKSFDKFGFVHRGTKDMFHYKNIIFHCEINIVTEEI